MFTQQEKRKKKRNSSEPAGLVHRSPIAQRNLRGLENLHHDVCGSITANLASALRLLRQAYVHSALWQPALILPPNTCMAMSITPIPKLSVN